MKPTKAQLINALRQTQIWRITQPGLTGEKVVGRSCQLCGESWKGSTSRLEKHKPDCVLEGTAEKRK